MTDIDWSKAPEGATHYFSATDEWYMVGDMDHAMAWAGRWIAATMYSYRKDRMIPRTDQAWNGEGLPPVGTVCEMRHNMWDYEKWEKAKIMYASNDYVIAKFTSVEQHYHTYNVSLRPIRTPEQVAKDERSKACSAIYAILCSVERNGNRSDMADALYDAGFRKPC